MNAIKQLGLCAALTALAFGVPLSVVGAAWAMSNRLPSDNSTQAEPKEDILVETLEECLKRKNSDGVTTAAEQSSCALSTATIPESQRTQTTFPDTSSLEVSL